LVFWPIQLEMDFFKKVFRQRFPENEDNTVGSTGQLMSKDELKQAVQRLSLEVSRLQPPAEKMTELLVKLQREYGTSKAHDPLTRYNVLKDLIKCFLDDWTANRLHLVRTSPSETGSASSGAVGLVQRAKQMAKTQESLNERKEKYRGFSLAELRDEHESLKKESKRLQEFVSKCPRAVSTLESEYESSKQFDAMRRYKILKDLIKETLSVLEPS